MPRNYSELHFNIRIYNLVKQFWNEIIESTCLKISTKLYCYKLYFSEYKLLNISCRISQYVRPLELWNIWANSHLNETTSFMTAINLISISIFRHRIFWNEHTSNAFLMKLRYNNLKKRMESLRIYESL